MGLDKILVKSECLEYTHKYNERAPEQLKARHCHEGYELLYVLRGSGRLLVEGTEIDFTKGSLIVIKPFQYHCIDVDLNDGYERYVIHFSLDSLLRDMRPVLDGLTSYAEGEGEVGFFCAADHFDKHIGLIAGSIEGAADLPMESRDLFLKHQLSALIGLIAGHGKAITLHTGNELGAEIAKYVNRLLDTNITLDMIAKHFFMSKYYISHVFKRYSGVSLHAYITQKRVAHARQLIVQGNTAAAAAYKVGFGDYSAFYRAYVKIYGKPPSS